MKTDSDKVPGWVWLGLTAAHLLALAWVLHAQSWSFPDSDRYRQAADNLRQHGQLYARPWPVAAPRGQAVQEFTIRPPGYPLLVLALGAAGAGRPLALLLLQNGLSLWSLGAVLRWWGRRFRPGRGQWRAALGLALSFPAQLIYANALMSEVLLQAVVLAGVGAGLGFLRTRRGRDFALAGAALAAALLIKPVFYPLAAGLAGLGGGLAVWWRRPGLAAAGLLPLLVALAYMGWNEQRTGYFHFSSISTINLLHYNAAGVVRQTAGPAAEEAWVAAVLRSANAAPTFAARQQLIQGRAAAVLLARPGVYARQQAQGLAAFFLDPGRFDLSQFFRLPMPAGGGLLAQLRAGRLLPALARLPAGLLALLALLTLLNAGRLGLAVRGFGRLKHGGGVGRRGRWLAAGLILYVALLTGPLGAARFVVPVWPLLLGLALAGLPPGPRGPAAAGAAGTGEAAVAPAASPAPLPEI